MFNSVLAGVEPGAKVLIDGVPHQARRKIGDGCVFADPRTGDEILLSGAAQREMAREFRLVLDDLPKNIVKHIARARETDFKVFSFADRTVALRRLRYVQEVHRQPAHLRRRKAVIQECSEVVFDALKKEALADVTQPDELSTDAAPVKELKTVAEAIRDELMKRLEADGERGPRPAPEKKAASVRSIRRWYKAYYASGQDIRVLLPLYCLRGNRNPRYPEWVKKSIEKTIEDAILCPTPASFADAGRLACAQVERDAGAMPLPDLAEKAGGKALLGQNLVRKWVRKLDRFQVTNRQLGIREAEREFSAVELGPQGEFANHEWEADHTLMNIFCIDPIGKKAYGRPWLTVILDRYTRCITGYSISFAPPSWVNIMDAMRVAVLPKKRILDALNSGGAKITHDWPCYGPPGVLITDHGAEFKSQSMDETLASIGVRPLQAKKGKPWLRGKIERWFRSKSEFLHTLPGTTFANFYKRKFYKSEKFAVLTLAQVNWLVAKWIIDVYHQKEHSKLKCSPVEMWQRSVIAHKPPRKVKPEDLEPLMGLVVNRSLRRGGVKYMGMRWDSQGFARLRGRLPKDADVCIRIDPRDLNNAYAWDDANNRWVSGRLMEPKEAGNYTLDQWHYIDTARKQYMREGRMNREKAVAKAIREIDDFVSGIREGYKQSKAYKAYLELATQGRSAMDVLLASYTDPEEDGAIKPHVLGETEIRGKPADGAPYRDDNAPPLAPEDPSEDDTGETAEEEETTGDEKASAAEPTSVRKPSRKSTKNAVKSAKATEAAAKNDAGERKAQEPPPPTTPDDDYEEDDFSGPMTVRKTAET